jgi:DNA-binding Xre family transcriptional regulator
MSRKTTVKKRMQQLGITHSQIAHYCVLSNHVLQLWIDGKAVVPYNNLLRIAHLLDLEPDELVEIV